MSWQQFKSIGEKLYSDLAKKHKPTHVRSILKVLEGERIRGEIEVMDSHMAAAEAVFETLQSLEPRIARKILAYVDAQLTRAAVGKRAEGEIDKLYGELRREFEPGPLRMILEAAERASKRPDLTPTRRNRGTGEPGNRGNGVTG